MACSVQATCVELVNRENEAEETNESGRVVVNVWLVVARLIGCLGDLAAVIAVSGSCPN